MNKYNILTNLAMFCLEEHNIYFRDFKANLVQKEALKFVSQYHFKPENECVASFKHDNSEKTMKIVNQNQKITQRDINKNHLKKIIKAYNVFIEIVSMRNPPEFITTYLNDCFINR